MERRRALKTLAAGSVATGIAIQSSPAFAYSEPIVAGTPTASITTLSGTGRARIDLTYTSATCPASATSSSVTRSLTVTRIFTGTARVFSVDIGEVLGGSGTTVSPTPPTSVLLQKRNSANTMDRNWFLGNGSNSNRIRVEVVETHTCTYSDGTMRSVTVSFAKTFRYNGGPWV